MIIKTQDIKNIDIKKNQFILLYGKNDGLKNQVINDLFKNKKIDTKYEEKEILINKENFLESLSSKSLFEKEKIIIIKNASDKILDLINKIINKNYEDIKIVIEAELLDKKSKLRSLFEKEKKLICIPFYPDNESTLSNLAYEFFRKRKISISSSNINLIITKCNGDRKILFSELEKLEFYSKNKKINTDIIIKLTNLIENHSISELVDNCLAQNKQKAINILNENNFGNDDGILITRVMLNKLKKILKLSNEFQKNRNIELTIATSKPPIFWKDKEITKKQIIKWNPNEIKLTIYKLTDVELMIKKNINNSIGLITDFILELSSKKTNN